MNKEATMEYEEKILLVDDGPDLTFVFKKGLEHAGLSADAFNKSAKCLKSLSHTSMISNS